MPSSDLTSLSITAQASIRGKFYNIYSHVFGLGNINVRHMTFRFYYHLISIKKKQMISLLVLTALSTQHFALKPEAPTTTALRAISEQVYLKFTSDERPSIVIECKSLADLKLDFDALALDLKIDTERPIESIEDWM